METDILVTGGTGQHGGTILRDLVAAGHRVRAASRHPERMAMPDVDCVRLDWQNSATFRPALGSIRQIVLVVPEATSALGPIIEDFLRCAAAEGTEHVILLSALGVDQLEMLPLRQVEHAVLAGHVGATILRSNWFMQNFTGPPFQSTIVDRDEIAVPAEGARVSFVDLHDVAAAVSATLRRPAPRHAEFVLTGQQALGFGDIAAQIGQVTGRHIRYEALRADDPRLMERMGLPGQDPWGAQMLFERVRAGLEAVTSDDLHDLIGREPGTFAAFARGHAESWRR